MTWLLILIMQFNFNQFTNPNHIPLFKSKDRELIVYGGAGAGKSYSIADKLLELSVLTSSRPTKTLLIRKTLASLKRTSLDILQRRADVFKLDLRINKGDWTAQCNNMQFIMSGMNNREDYLKIKSMTDVDWMWVNELPEMREADYTELLLRLRGTKGTDEFSFRQIISDFNPIGKTSWVYKRFFEQDINKARKLRYTVKHNPWAEKEYIQSLKDSEKWDSNYYKIYFLGEWGELEGIIYPNWDIVALPDRKFDEIFYGGDFGYSVNPAAVVRIYRKADEYWIEEIIYETGLTNTQLGQKMQERNITQNDITYWDSAEPKSIQELCDMRLTALPAVKGPDSVRAGIDLLKTLKIHIVEGSENVIREQKSYIWKKDKDGNPLNKPIEFNDHAMSAIRYGIYTQLKNAWPYEYKIYYKGDVNVS